MTFTARSVINDSADKSRTAVRPSIAQATQQSAATTALPVIQRKLDCACDGGCPRCSSGIIQPKLTIGQPNDKYEQEADSVADRVMRMPDPQVQRTCTSCGDMEEEAAIQTKAIGDTITPLVQRQEEEPEEEEEPAQAKSRNNKSPPLAAGSGLHSTINSFRGGGQPLPASTRSYFEPRFGKDFSDVRVHTGSTASEAANSINARAFTMGKDVVFGSGQYSPGTTTGKQLLAHELTHTIQQGKSTVPVQQIQRHDTGWRYTPPATVTRPIREIQAIVGTTPDGIYGHHTRDAVINYQRVLAAQGLYTDTIDGKWGKNTEAAHVAYSTTSRVHGYNCSGLAFKTFRWHNLNTSRPGAPSTRVILATMRSLPSCTNRCNPFQYKFWFWTYDYSRTNLRTGTTTPTAREFHIVGGQTDRRGNGPSVVVSKNGRRPVKGPAPPASWRPVSAFYRMPNYTDAVVPHLWVNRTNHHLDRDTCYCANSLP